MANWAREGTTIERKARGETEEVAVDLNQREHERRREWEKRLLADPEGRERAFQDIENLAGD